MVASSTRAQRTLEIILTIIVVGLACLLHISVGYKMAVLNLFFLPVVLASFFLGRYRAGILALFCVVAVTLVSVHNFASFAPLTSPVMVFLAITVWGAVLGLTTLLVGTLSDDRAARTQELHEAYLGVVEVLSRYLNPSLLERSRRVSELSRRVAEQMKLSERETDNIRVAALLQDMENLEITARVLQKAVDDGSKASPHTFQGAEFALSLGSVLTGALPLLLGQEEPLTLGETAGAGTNGHELGAATGPSAGRCAWSGSAEVPFGARIIQTVRAYDAQTHGNGKSGGVSPKAALAQLRYNVDTEHHPAVLDALAKVVTDPDACGQWETSEAEEFLPDDLTSPATADV